MGLCLKTLNTSLTAKEAQIQVVISNYVLSTNNIKLIASIGPGTTAGETLQTTLQTLFNISK